MDFFEYKVSVIVPVYNVEQYLCSCLDSLLAQTIDHEQMEVLLINDGSTDNSLAICEEYAELFSCFKVFSQENAGVSAARNVGIRNAKGKYILYLDSDDTFSKETIENLINFFDESYDEIDLVSLRIVSYKNGSSLPTHFKYKYLTHTGIYEVEKYPYLTLSGINICVKNFFEHNVYFDTKYSFGEDTKYNCDIIKSTMKIGYCNETEYRYNRDNENSIVATCGVILSFESSLNRFEELFSFFGENVPAYFQGLFLTLMNWKLTDNSLFPVNLPDDKEISNMSRLSNLLDCVDVKTILNHPSMNIFHKIYWISLRRKSLPTYICQKDMISLYDHDILLYKRSSIEIIVQKVSAFGSKFRIQAFLKSPVFNFVKRDNVKLYVIKDDNFGDKKELELEESVHSYYQVSVKTNSFFAFNYEDFLSDFSFEFAVCMDGVMLKTTFFFMPTCVFNSNLDRNDIILGGFLLSYNKNRFSLEHIDFDIQKQMLVKNSKCYSGKYHCIEEIRQSVIKNKEVQKQIWLYYDSGKQVDNGFYQFVHDISKNDGIERYYIIDDMIQRTEEFNAFLNGNQSYAKNVVRFKSLKHKVLYLSASIILTSYIERISISPFNNYLEEQYFLDLEDNIVIYLQHGILHAHLPQYYMADRHLREKVVISSRFEHDNLINNYHYRNDDLIETGMSRFDRLNSLIMERRNSSSIGGMHRKILFAPSWRSYFSVKTDNGQTDISLSRILSSSYFHNIEELIMSKKLNDTLNIHNIDLDIKLHPMMCEVDLQIKSDRIRLIDNVKETDYSLFITDFSSYLFDFVYIGVPILHFIPDYAEFAIGKNHYYKLDIPWEQAFGNLTLNPDEAVNEVIRIIENEFVPDPVFKERMDNFYPPLENCAERLYQYLRR